MRFRLAQGPRAGREGEQDQGSKPTALVAFGAPHASLWGRSGREAGRHIAFQP